MKRHLFIVAALTGTLALAGCDQAEDTEQDAQAETTTQTESAAQGDAEQDGQQQASKTLDGVLEFAATDTPLPDDARVVVSLRDVALADAPATIVAERTIEVTGNDPVEFRLDYPTEQVDPGHTHALHAEVFNGEGKLRWTSPERHPVEVGPEAEQEPITLVLEPISSGTNDEDDLQEAQQDLLEPAEDAPDTGGEAESDPEALDEQASEMQEPTPGGEESATASQ